MATLHVIDKRHGDKRVQWEKDNKKDIAKAKRLFNQKLKDGWMAFGYKAGEKVGQLIRTFDAVFDRILMVPPVAGG